MVLNWKIGEGGARNRQLEREGRDSGLTLRQGRASGLCFKGSIESSRWDWTKTILPLSDKGSLNESEPSLLNALATNRTLYRAHLKINREALGRCASRSFGHAGSAVERALADTKNTFCVKDE
jgi:hypothetical protein